MDELAKKRTSQPCPICGGTSYAWGILYANGIIFEPGNPSMLVTNGARQLTRLCNDCGNLQLFKDQIPRAGKLPE